VGIALPRVAGEGPAGGANSVPIQGTGL